MNSALKKIRHQPLAEASGMVSFGKPAEGGQTNNVAL